MHQSKDEGDQRGPLPCPGLASMERFGAHEHDRQRNRCLDGRRTQHKKPKSTGCECHAVGKRESRNCGDQALAKTDQKQEADHEE